MAALGEARLHEFGRGIGFPDHYDRDGWAPGVAAPACVMSAGRVTVATDWDKWMFRRTWSELSRMNRWRWLPVVIWSSNLANSS